MGIQRNSSKRILDPSIAFIINSQAVENIRYQLTWEENNKQDLCVPLVTVAVGNILSDFISASHFQEIKLLLIC